MALNTAAIFHLLPSQILGFTALGSSGPNRLARPVPHGGKKRAACSHLFCHGRFGRPQVHPLGRSGGLSSMTDQFHPFRCSQAAARHIAVRVVARCAWSAPCSSRVPSEICPETRHILRRWKAFRPSGTRQSFRAILATVRFPFAALASYGRTNSQDRSRVLPYLLRRCTHPVLALRSSRARRQVRS